MSLRISETLSATYIGTDAAGLVWLQRACFPHTTFHITLFDYEVTWKKYVATLNELFGERVCASFAPCNVTQPLEHDENRRVASLDLVDLFMFFYVCHETSSKQKPHLPFYADVARRARPGSIVVFAEVQVHAAAHLARVAAAMASQREVTELAVSRRHAAELLILRFGELRSP